MIYIEARNKQEACIIFRNRFKRDYDNVTCNCCGSDYSINVSDTLAEATAYDRNCAYENGKYVEKLDRSYPREDSKKYITLDEYVNTATRVDWRRGEKVLFLFDKDIKPEDKLAPYDYNPYRNEYW